MPPFALLPWRHLRLHGAQQSAAVAELHFAVTTEKVEKVRTSGWDGVLSCVHSVNAMIRVVCKTSFDPLLELVLVLEKGEDVGSFFHMIHHPFEEYWGNFFQRGISKAPKIMFHHLHRCFLQVAWLLGQHQRFGCTSGRTWS